MLFRVRAHVRERFQHHEKSDDDPRRLEKEIEHESKQYGQVHGDDAGVGLGKYFHHIFLHSHLVLVAEERIQVVGEKGHASQENEQYIPKREWRLFCKQQRANKDEVAKVEPAVVEREEYCQKQLAADSQNPKRSERSVGGVEEQDAKKREAADDDALQPVREQDVSNRSLQNDCQHQREKVGREQERERRVGAQPFQQEHIAKVTATF